MEGKKTSEKREIERERESERDGKVEGGGQKVAHRQRKGFSLAK